jgi:hypothetical protein
MKKALTTALSAALAMAIAVPATAGRIEASRHICRAKHNGRMAP